MNKRKTNPKPEGRRPKPEYSAGPLISEFWNWGVERTDELAVLREQSPAPNGPQDLGERTAVFGEAIIAFAKQVPHNAVNDRLISQLVGAGTSIGANYCEADDSVSGKEFKQKIGTCRKESKETMFFLRMVANQSPRLRLKRAGSGARLRSSTSSSALFGGSDA